MSVCVSGDNLWSYVCKANDRSDLSTLVITSVRQAIRRKSKLKDCCRTLEKNQFLLLLFIRAVDRYKLECPPCSHLKLCPDNLFLFLKTLKFSHVPDRSNGININCFIKETAVFGWDNNIIIGLKRGSGLDVRQSNEVSGVINCKNFLTGWLSASQKGLGSNLLVALSLIVKRFVVEKNGRKDVRTTVFVTHLKISHGSVLQKEINSLTRSYNRKVLGEINYMSRLCVCEFLTGTLQIRISLQLWLGFIWFHLAWYGLALFKWDFRFSRLRVWRCRVVS
jgi:hypothetical protein